MTTNQLELETLSKAPIAEAILDIFVEGLEDVPVEKFEEFWKQNYESEFPKKKTRRHFKLAMQAEVGPAREGQTNSASTELTNTALGFLFSSEDGLNVFQTRKDGFTCNRLRPYQKWENLRDTAKRIWSKFNEEFKPQRVTKISLRYVNNFVIDGENAGDYFVLGPNLPPEFPNTFEHLLLQFKTLLPELDAAVTCNFGFGPMTKGTFLYDLAIESSVVGSEDEMWSKFEEFRKLKNKYFKAAITPQFLEELR